MFILSHLGYLHILSSGESGSSEPVGNENLQITAQTLQF